MHYDVVLVLKIAFAILHVLDCMVTQIKLVVVVVDQNYGLGWKEISGEESEFLDNSMSLVSLVIPWHWRESR